MSGNSLMVEDKEAVASLKVRDALVSRTVIKEGIKEHFTTLVTVIDNE
jgi:hypothetical protein